jgi:glycosyltransferase involved in cell wall biosynthesis
MQLKSLGIVTPQLSEYGGSEIYLFECLRRWQETLDITVYTPSFKRSLFDEFGVDPKVKVVVLPSARTSDKRLRLFYETVFLPRIWERQIRQHDLYFLYLFPMHLIQRRPSVWFAAEPFRMLYDLRNHMRGKGEVKIHVYPKIEYERVLERDLDIILQFIETMDSTAGFDRLATNSRLTGQYIENIYGRKPDRIVYPGISISGKFSPPPTFDKVLYVGRLWPHKRVDLILKAMALTRSPNKLIIAGNGPEKPKLKTLTKELGLKGSVHFLGEVSMEERRRLFSECTCCVYVPVREPFGMVPLEAAAAGRPVVAAIGGGYSEILTKNAALMVPAYEGAIAEAIHHLMSNPARAMEMGQAGKKIVEQHTWERTADTLMDLFHDTVHDHVGKKKGNSRKSVDVPRPQLGAHYYPWYRSGKNPLHWNENPEFAGVTDIPIGGYYSSKSLSVINRHLMQAVRSGIDFFVVNWQVDFRGLNSMELESTEKLFEMVEKKGYPLKLSILLAINAEDPEIIMNAIRHVKKELMPRDSYHRHNKRSLLWYFFNDSFLGHLFHHYKELARLSRGIYSIATGEIAYNKFIPRLVKDFFKGWCFYSPLEVGPKKTRESIWLDSYRCLSEEVEKIPIFTISPGFDDSHLISEERREKKHRHVPRQSLKTYQMMQESALNLKPPPDYVIITSFNEFHENTHIEPSENYGDQYLRSTKAFKERLNV